MLEESTNRPPAIRPPRRRSLTVDVLLTFGSKVGVLVLTVATGVVIARALGPSGRGAIAVALAFTLLLVQFGILGLHSANAYFAARTPEQISQILTNTLWSALGLGLLLAVIGLTARELAPASLRGLDSPEVAVVLIGIPAVLATQLLQGVLLAEGKMVVYNGVELAMTLATLVGLAVILLALSGGVLSALILIVTVNVVGALAFVFSLRHHVHGLRHFDRALFRSMLRYGFRIYLAGLLAFLIWRTNLLLVNAYLGSASAGRFSVAVALGDSIHLLPTVVALNLFPRVARGDALSDTGTVFRSLALVYAGLCVAIIPLLGPVIRLLYGGSFSGAVAIAYWLLPGIYAYGMVSVLSYHFAGRGFPLGALVVWIVGAALNFGLAFPLLADQRDVAYGAIATSAAYVVILALHIRMFAAETGSYASLVPRPRETVAFMREIARTLIPNRNAAPAHEA